MSDMYDHMSKGFEKSDLENGMKYSRQLKDCSNACRGVARCANHDNIVIHKEVFLGIIKDHGLWWW
jgi:hypothetical protein